jgi:tripartite-type tricarboxylate transporter receptor subunit TctC
LRKPERLCSFPQVEDWMHLLGLALAGVCALASHGAVASEAFPARAITIVIGASAGGITDVSVRAYAPVVSRALGQPVRIDNRPSEAGAQAAATVQNATPDGYMLLAFQGAQHSALPAIQFAGYEPVKGFAPVTVLFTLANFLAVPANSPANSVPDLLRLGREKSGGLVFGSSGIGTTSHLTAARLSLSTGVPVAIKHYAGASPMIGDLVSGKLDFTFVSYAVAKPYGQQGRLRLLAVDAEKRRADRLSVPTLREAGIDQPRVASWFALAAPARTPDVVVRRLHDAFAQAAREPEVIKSVRAAGAEVTTSSPEELARMMEREARDEAELVRTLKLRQP